MTTQKLKDSSDEDFVNFQYILQFLWTSRALILQGFLGAIFLASVYLFVAEKKYSTYFVLNPMKEQKAAQLQSLVSTIVGSSNRDAVNHGEFSELMYVMTSVSVASELMKDPLIVRKVFESEWDEQKGVWHPPHSVLGAIKRVVFFVLRYPPYIPPSPYRLSEFLKLKITMEPIKDSRLFRVSFLSSDRQFAQNLLTRIYEIADHMIRTQKVLQTRKTLEYINNRLIDITNVINRRSLTDLLTAYEQELLLLETDLPFVARKLGEAESSDWPIFPPVGLTLIIAAALGVVAGVLAALVRRTFCSS